VLFIMLQEITSVATWSRGQSIWIFLLARRSGKIWTLERLAATRTIHNPGISALLLCFEPCPFLTKVEPLSLTLQVRQLFSVHEDRHRAIPFVEFLELALELTCSARWMKSDTFALRSLLILSRTF
jgi:hypothetical protein